MSTQFKTLRSFIKEFESSYATGALGQPTEETIETDDELCITINMPLFIRLMEYAKEDAKSDVDIHYVAQNVGKLSQDGRCLTMEDYDDVIAQGHFDNKGEQVSDDKKTNQETNVKSMLDTSSIRERLHRKLMHMDAFGKVTDMGEVS